MCNACGAGQETLTAAKNWFPDKEELAQAAVTAVLAKLGAVTQGKILHSLLIPSSSKTPTDFSWVWNFRAWPTTCSNKKHTGGKVCMWDFQIISVLPRKWIENFHWLKWGRVKLIQSGFENASYLYIFNICFSLFFPAIQRVKGFCALSLNSQVLLGR